MDKITSKNRAASALPRPLPPRGARSRAEPSRAGPLASLGDCFNPGEIPALLRGRSADALFRR